MREMHGHGTDEIVIGFPGVKTRLTVKTSAVMHNRWIQVRWWRNGARKQLILLGGALLVLFGLPLVPVAEALGESSIGAGAAHTCVLLSDGTVACWGRNMSGQVGRGTVGNFPIAVQVPGISAATAIAAGLVQTCRCSLRIRVGESSFFSRRIFLTGIDSRLGGALYGLRRSRMLG